MIASQRSRCVVLMQTAGFFFLVSYSLIAQVVSLHPIRVIDLKTSTNRDLGKVGLQIDILTEESGHWAAVIRGNSGTESFAVLGDALTERAIALKGAFDRAKLDANGHLHMRQTRPRVTTSGPRLYYSSTGYSGYWLQIVDHARAFARPPRRR